MSFTFWAFMEIAERTIGMPTVGAFSETPFTNNMEFVITNQEAIADTTVFTACPFHGA